MASAVCDTALSAIAEPTRSWTVGELNPGMYGLYQHRQPYGPVQGSATLSGTAIR